MTKVLLFFFCLFSVLSPLSAAQRGVLKLSGFVPPRAHVEIHSVSQKDDVVELTLKKNTQYLNFRMVLEADRPGRSPLSLEGGRGAKQFTLSHRGQYLKVDLRELREKSNRLRMTILSP